MLRENQFKMWVWIANYLVVGLILAGFLLGETLTPADLVSTIAPAHTVSRTATPLWSLPSITDDLTNQVTNLCGQTHAQLLSSPPDIIIRLKLNENICTDYHELDTIIEQVLTNGER